MRFYCKGPIIVNVYWERERPPCAMHLCCGGRQQPASWRTPTASSREGSLRAAVAVACSLAGSFPGYWAVQKTHLLAALTLISGAPSGPPRVSARPTPRTCTSRAHDRVVSALTRQRFRADHALAAVRTSSSMGKCPSSACAPSLHPLTGWSARNDARRTRPPPGVPLVRMPANATATRARCSGAAQRAAECARGCPCCVR